MKDIFPAVRGLVFRAVAWISSVWKRFRSLRPRLQLGIGILVVILIIALFAVLRSSTAPASTESLRSVSLKSVGELSGSLQGGIVFGTVRSVSESHILAEASGTLEAVHTTLGASVPAGFIIAELENASERASVLQAEGVYDAAVAARDATSLSETEVSAEATYRSAFATLDDVVETDVDAFFTGPSSDPNLTIDGGGWESQLSRDRGTIHTKMVAWRNNLSTAGTRNPQALLEEAGQTTEFVATFLNDLARVANRPNSRATETQLSGLASGRSSVNTLIGTLSSARSTFQSGSVGATASADASVKQALGALRLAQANLEKTRVRAPLAGTINYLPFRTGEYVSANTHVATVARNEALEVIAYVSETTREILVVGSDVVIEGEVPGIITSLSPALDPITKQIEVRIAVTDTAQTLVNGASVDIALTEAARTAKTDGPVTLPLAAIKLRADDRVVFSINEEGRLVAHLIETGSVRGDRIEITSPLPQELLIVSDARGLAEGQKVQVLP